MSVSETGVVNAEPAPGPSPGNAGGVADETGIPAAADDERSGIPRRRAIGLAVAVVVLATGGVATWMTTSVTGPARNGAPAEAAAGFADEPSPSRSERLRSSSDASVPEDANELGTPVDDAPAPARVAGRSTATAPGPASAESLSSLLGSRPVLVSLTEPKRVTTDDGRHHVVGERTKRGAILAAIERDGLTFEREGERVVVALPPGFGTGSADPR